LCHTILFLPNQIHSITLHNLVKLMIDHKNGYGQFMVIRYCELALRLCTSNDLIICVDEADDYRLTKLPIIQINDLNVKKDEQTG